MRWIPRKRYSIRRNGSSPIGLTKLTTIMGIATLLIMVTLGLGSYVQTKWFNTPAGTMKGLTAQITSEFFIDMLALEARALPEDQTKYTFSGMNIANFMARFLIDVNPADPRSLLASELPGLSGKQPTLLRASSDGGEAPRDEHPQPIVVDGKEPQVGEQTPQPTDEHGGEPQPSPLPSIGKVNMEQVYELVDNRHAFPDNKDNASGSGGDVPASLSETNKVFIYHSHPQESFLPELPDAKQASDAFDKRTNISLVGKHLADTLSGLGIGAYSSGVDYQDTVPGYNWNFSYKYSMKTVQEAFASNPELEYFIDVHRDSAGRETTTKDFDGQSYAKIAFVIGQENPNWEKNEAFAAEIHKSLEAQYPGLSRGTWGKDRKTGHGEYNQSVSPNSILIEVGGVENSLEECYRTMEVLARIMSEIVIDAEKVDASMDTRAEAT